MVPNSIGKARFFIVAIIASNLSAEFRADDARAAFRQRASQFLQR
jgi:hypothetical protein